MYVTLKITPLRVIIPFLIVLLWYCFIGTNDTHSIEFSNNYEKLYALPNRDTSKFNNQQRIELKLTNHKQRILTAPQTDTHTELSPLKFPPIPSVVGIGPEKCGTSSMNYMLTRHTDKIPEIIKPVHEPTGIDAEMRVWLPCGNANFEETLKNVLRDGAPTKGQNYCSLGWYQHFWSPPIDDIRHLHYYINDSDKFAQIIANQKNSVGRNNKLYEIINDENMEYNIHNPVTWHWRYYYYFEKSPAYWCYEHVAYLFNKLLVPQGTKFFVLMRDPIKRTYSFWSHQNGLGHLHTKWPQFITTSLQNGHVQNMISLLKDGNQSILHIKAELLKEWKAYVYANDMGYGYIGQRDEVQRMKRNKRGNRPAVNRNRNNNNIPRRKPLAFVNETMHNRKLLWSAREPGFVKADTNPKLGLGASCYVIPLLMWLEYIPLTHVSVMQSELMYGGNHNKFVSDVRCWIALGYEYDSIEQCRNERLKEVIVSEEHMTHSAKGKMQDSDARTLNDQFFGYCNQRLKELLEIDAYQDLTLHQMKWDAWYS